MPPKKQPTPPSKSASRQDRKYLTQRGSIWYARVIVPPSLQDAIGATHLKVSLRTSDLAEANRRKLSAVYEFKQQIERAKRGVDWKDWREAIQNAKNDTEQAILQELAADWAEKKAAVIGEDKAIKQLQKVLSTDLVLSEAVELFLGKGDISTDAHRKHSRALKDFTDYFKEDPPLGTITARDLLNFTDTLVATDLAPNTKRDRLSSLGSFWDWLERRLHVPRGVNPFRGITIKGGTVEDSRAYTPKELETLLHSKFSQNWQRDAFVILLLTGARPNEILGLRHKDIDLVAKTFSITTAKTEAGIRTLPYRHAALVEIFGRLYRSLAQPDDRIFPVDPKTDKPAKNFINYFSRHKVTVGLPTDATLYSARKTFATKALDLNLDVVNVERYIGHKNQRLALSVYSKGRSDDGLIEVAEGIAAGWKIFAEKI